MTSTDFSAVFWKEWKEIVLERSAGGAGSYRPLILVALLGILLPLRMGPARFFTPSQLLIYSFFSAVVVTAVIADSFAGERERHTLETLLATRLSDRAILFGKIAASLAYGWLVAMLCVLCGTITVNVANWDGHLLLYRDWASWLVLLLGPPLVGGVVATAGVLISLHAATVRHAQQTLMVGFTILFLGVIFGGNMLPDAWKLWFGGILVAWSPAALVLAGAGVVLMIDIALLLAGMARFQRARLVLD
ncbi:MAG TPA: ABC transporter permease subunit [Bryobacteraceae bacterium]|jgi:ABC-2 type transport system permease protein|nr:ABC transporter permease subunit [Bryobacteraceae bacterium]